MAPAISGKVAAISCARAWGAGLVRAAKKRLKAKGRDDGGFIFLSLSLASSVAEAFLVFPFLELEPEQAACASVGVVLGV